VTEMRASVEQVLAGVTEAKMHTQSQLEDLKRRPCAMRIIG
jgi:hypothetical protein